MTEQRPEPRSRPLRALVVSVIAHALLLWFVWTVPLKPRELPEKKTYISFITKATPWKYPPLEETPPAPSARPPVAKPTQQRPPIGAPSVLPGPPPPPVAAPAPPPTPAPEPPAVLAAPNGTNGAAPGHVDLFSADALHGVAAQSVEQEKNKHAAETPPEPQEKDRINQRLTGVLTESSARSRVQQGLYDPSYAAMGHEFFDAWDPNRVVTKDVIKLLGQNTGESLRQWQEAGHNYARSGSAMVPGRDFVEPKLVREEGSGIGGDAAREHTAYNRYVNGDFTQGHTAHVLVDESPDRLTVKLVESSGDITVDKAAVEDVRNALERMRRNDPETRTRTRKSLWAMRLQIIINPPVPMLGVTFDEVLLRPQVELPLGRRLLKHVELEAVYDDDPRMKPAKAPPG